MRTAATILTLILAFSLFTLANAAPQDAQSTVGTTGTYSGVTVANGVATQGGNVTENRPVYSDLSTLKWQGLWGNISASLNLGDGTDTFYAWTPSSFQAVYASPQSSVNWSSISAINSQAGREAADTHYGLDSANTDSINQTMNGNTCDAGTIITGASGVYAYNGSGFPGTWETCIATDGPASTDYVFGTTVTTDTGYNGQTVDYQLMLPVNSTGQDYWLYLEI